MPRVKSTPVRRTVHRFHDSSHTFQQDQTYLDTEGKDNEDELKEENVPDEVQSSANEQIASGDLESLPTETKETSCSTPIAQSVIRDEDSKVLMIYECLDQLKSKDHVLLSSHLLPMSLPLDMNISSGCQYIIRLTYMEIRCGDFSCKVASNKVVSNWLTEALGNGSIRITYRALDDAQELTFYCMTLVNDVPEVALEFLFNDVGQNVWSSNGATYLDFDATRWLDVIEKQQKIIIDDQVLRKLSLDLKSLGVKTNLRQYQSEGIAWMMSRLKEDFQHTNLMGYIKLPLIVNDENITFYYSPYYKTLLHESAIKALQSSLKGLILADEMGLGKSLQILSLILLKRVPSYNEEYADRQIVVEFICSLSMVQNLSSRTSKLKANDALPSSCFCGRNNLVKNDIAWIMCKGCNYSRHARCCGLTNESEVQQSIGKFTCIGCQALYYQVNPLQCRTALIIMPNTLLNQWQAEVKKHLDGKTSFKVFVWDEDSFTKKDRFAHDYSAETLAQYDIIMLSFGALKKAYYMSNIPWNECGLKQLKNNIFPPAFLCLNFEMIVVDETQNLEGTSESHALQIACKIYSKYRICVSGTPLGNNTLTDLASLMQFLKIEPFVDNWRAWKQMIVRPRIPIDPQIRMQWITEFFQEIMLRRTKAAVIAQLGLPSRLVTIRYLKFSPFEQALYNEKLAFIFKDIDEARSKPGFDRLDLGDMKNKLEVLRKGCCHPQLLDSKLRGQVTSTSVSRPLDHIMINKVEQAKTRSEEMQRNVLFYLFKIAGLVWLQAECCHLRPTQSFDDKSEIECLLQAYAFYAMAWKCIQANCTPYPAIGLVKVTGCELPTDDIISSFIKTMSLTWKLPMIKVAYDSRQESNLTSSSISSISTQDNALCDWGNVNLNSSVELRKSISDVVLAQAGNKAVGEVSLSTSVNCKMHFSHNKTFTTINGQLDLKQLQDYLQNELAEETSCLIAIPSYLVFRPHLQHGTVEEYLTCHVEHDLLSGDHQSFQSYHSDSNLNRDPPLLPKCKIWQLSINMISACGLVFRKDSQGNLLGCVWDFKVHTRSAQNMPVKSFVRISLEETNFDVDDLQKLHLSYNLINTFEALVEPLKQTDDRLSILSQIENVANSSKIADTSTIPDKITEIFRHPIEQTAYNDEIQDKLVEPPSPVTGKRTYEISAAAEVTPKKTRRVNMQDEGEVTPAAYSANNAHIATNKLCSTLLKVANSIEYLYLNTSLTQKAGAIMKLKNTSREIEILEQEMDEKYDRMWWTNALRDLEGDRLFLGTLESNILQGELAYKKLQNVRDVNGLLYVIGIEFEELVKARKNAVSAIMGLQRNPKKKEVANSTNCHNCREYFGKTGPLCWHCQLYSRSLFDYRTKHITASRRQVARLKTVAKPNGNSSRELGGANELFQLEEDIEVRKFDEGIVDGPYFMCAKLLKSFVTKYNLEDYVEVSKLEMKWIDLVVKEMNEMSTVWDKYSDILKRYDELDQSRLRVHLKLSNQYDRSAESGLETFAPSELSREINTTIWSLEDSDQQLQEAKSALSFYRHQTSFQLLQLEMGPAKEGANDKENGADQEEKCVICMERLVYFDEGLQADENSEDNVPVVLPCAHHFHRACAMNWVRPYRRCPLCKQNTKPEEVLVVKRRKSLRLKAESPDQLQVRYLDNPTMNDKNVESYLKILKVDYEKAHSSVMGRWGVKVDAIVTDLMLLLNHPGQAEQKVIVFSQWHEMLEILMEAMERNGIRSVMCRSKGKDFQQAGPIEVFRNSTDIRVLLLPLALGAEGLDLIVASHVFILEPLLNMQQEMQAINRIYRIGQTRSTMIHKYAVRGTIEEKILDFQRGVSEGMDSNAEGVDDNAGTSSVPVQSRGLNVVKGLKRDDGSLTVEDIESILVK